jgi:hypothetical protein
MDKHVIEWLGTYLDGELQPDLSNQVRDHLAICHECRQELASLENLSGLLRSIPVPAANTVKFRARLDAQLPARPVIAISHSSKHIIWWLIPILVLIVMLISQIAFGLTVAILAADQTGLLGGLIIDTGPVISQSEPLSSLVIQALEGNLVPFFAIFTSSLGLAVDLLFSITWQLALAFLYVAWLVAVWNNRSRLLVAPAATLKNHGVSIGV